jgi:heat shock protein HslJ
MPSTPDRGGLAWALLASQLLIGNVQSAPLQGSEWRPVRMDEISVPQEFSAFVQFRSKGRLAGFSGCNRLFAEYQVDSTGQIFVGPVAATRKVCPASVMERERALAAALENARSYQRRNTVLVLFDSDARPVLEMRQTDWD